MNKKLLIISLIALFVISACTSSNSTETTATENFAKKTSESIVTIDLEPHQFENGILDIDISLNTHTIDMSQFDLTKQVMLVMDGVEYYPVSAPSLASARISWPFFKASSSLVKISLLSIVFSPCVIYRQS